MIRAAIVDDEPNSCNVLKLILQNHCFGVEVVGIAHTFDDALQLVKEERPQLLFLDIEMPTGNGFYLSKHFSVRELKVVFVSAHTDRGAETYQNNALYYITKPVHINEVRTALERYRDAIAKEAATEHLDRKVTPVSWDDQLVLPETDGFRLIPYDQIICIDGFRSYCKIHLVGEKPILLSKLVKEVEAMLPRPRFLRTHRSYILHRPYIAKVTRSHRGAIELRDGSVTPVGKEYMDDIRRHLLGQVWG